MTDTRPNALGERIRAYREQRGMTLRECAELAGFDHSYLSRVETGKRSLDKRRHIQNLAAALRISPAELLGQPYAPTSREHTAANAAAEGIRKVLMAADLGGSGGLETWRPLEELGKAVDAARVMIYRYGDPAGAARGFPAVLAELHAHVAAGVQRDEALRILTLAACTGSDVSKWLGHPDLSWMVALRAREAARALGDPTMIALAEWRVVGAARPYVVARDRAEHAVNELQPHVGDDMVAMQVMGMLHLSAALDNAVVGRDADVRAHMQEVDELAARTGDRNAFECQFGPTNVQVWRMTIAVEQGQGGRARQIAAGLPASRIAAKSRQATYYQELGRALAQAGRVREAVHAILEAESLNTLEIRANPLARNLVLDLLPRVPATAGGIEVRGLARRMGIA